MFITTLFSNRNFRNYFFADIISGFGTGMSFIGANWFVLQHTGKNSAVGMVMMISFLSGFLVSPFAGTLADRFNRRTIMRVSNAVRAIIILIVATAIIVGSIKMYLIYLLAILSGIGWTVFIPASRGLVQEILTPEEYVNGSSLVEVSLQTGMFCAAAACGIIYKYSGFATILIIDAATFFVSNFFLSKIIYQAHIAHDREQSFITQFVNGGKYLMSNRALFWFGIIVFIPFVAVMSSNVVLPGYVSQYLKADSVVFGIDDALFGVGACISGFIAASISLKINKFRTTILFFLISITALFFLVSNSTILGLYIASLFFGLGNSSLRIVMNSQIMDVVPKSYMGRCQAVWMSVSMILQISSMYGVGRLMDNVSARYGFLWLACIMLIGFAGYLRLRPRFSSATATFAGGCFWCIEASFEKVPGVHEVVSGYTGGKKAGPTYEEVSSGTTGHLESIQVKYDPKKITYEQLLDIFWGQIDPTDDSGQFVDKGSQYRTAIFYNNEEQKRIALASKLKLGKSGVFNKPIVTEIIPAGIFYKAEEYHQDFHKKDPEHYKSYRMSSGRDEFLQKAHLKF